MYKDNAAWKIFFAILYSYKIHAEYITDHSRLNRQTSSESVGGRTESAEL